MRTESQQQDIWTGVRPKGRELVGVLSALICSLLWCSSASFAEPGGASRNAPAAAPATQASNLPPEYTPAALASIDKGLAWLARQQYEDGAFGRGRYYQKNAAITALACMAFMSEGSVPGRGRYAVNVERGLDFILDCSSGSGLLGDPTAGSPMYGHGFATLLLAELRGTSPRADLDEKLHKAVQLIVATQNAQGGWRYQPVRADADISVTITQVMALRAARNAGIAVPKETVDLAIRYIRRCQRPDGGFSYMINREPSAFPRSAGAVAALQYAGLYDTPEVRRGLEYLRQFRPGRAEVTGHYHYGHYYAVQAMFLAGETYWNDWYPAIRDELIARQRPDGSWTGQAGDEYGTAIALIILQVPNRLLPIFER